jgi:3-hydroxybutyryl-CoA dehydratase
VQDATRIAKVKVRFSRPVMIDDVVTYTGKVTAIENGRAVFEVAAKNQKGEDVLKGAVVEVRV